VTGGDIQLNGGGVVDDTGLSATRLKVQRTICLRRRGIDQRVGHVIHKRQPEMVNSAQMHLGHFWEGQRRAHEFALRSIP